MRRAPAAVVAPLFILLLLTLALALPAPARAYTVRLTPAEIDAAVRPYFPQAREGVFGRVTLSNPHVALTPGSDRLGVALTVRADLPGSAVIQADALVTGEVAWDPARREFHLREPRVVRLDAEGLEEPYASMVAEAVTAIAQTQIPVIVLYKVPADAPASAALQMLKRVGVKDGALELELGAP